MESEEKQVHDDESSKRARQRRIGSQLRKLYDEVVSEPVPDDFLELLEAADRKKSSTSQE